MDKPRLIVRFAVALIAFVIGITSTLLVNYFRPQRQAPPPVRYELRYESPRAHAPCPYHDSTVQHAYTWTVEAPPPPEPPPPPPPPRVRVRVVTR